MRKIVGTSASRGEGANKDTLLVKLEHEWPFKAEILVTSVSN